MSTAVDDSVQTGSGSSSGTVLRRTAAVPTSDGAVLHATIDGGDDAPVTLVLAHGWTLAQAAWDAVVELLMPRIKAGKLRLIRFDQPGHGRSTWADGEISIDRLGTDLGELLDQLVPSGRLVLAGHSMGGMTVMALAAARPGLFGDRVRGVALVSTAASDLDPEPTTAQDRVKRKLTPGALNAALAGARVIERLRQLLPPSSPRHQKLVRDLLYGPDATDATVLAGAEIMHASTVRAFAAFAPAFGVHDKLAELTALAGVPVEILVGSSDKLTPKRHSHDMAEALPHAALHVVDRTGHMLPSERPQLVAEALERLLDAAVS